MMNQPHILDRADGEPVLQHASAVLSGATDETMGLAPGRSAPGPKTSSPPNQPDIGVKHGKNS